MAVVGGQVMNTLFLVKVFQLVQAPDGLGPWVNRNQGVMCCLNGNGGCLREDITVTRPCVML